MKKPSAKSNDLFLDKPTTVLVKDENYIAFRGNFPTSVNLSHPFVFTPYVIRLYAQTPSEKEFADGAMKFVKQFDSSKVILDFPYIHFFEEDFLIFFKLKMKATPSHV
jgi:hypothetical protein